MKKGRPTKYEEKYNQQAYKLCLLGATDKEIGDFFEVSEQTINSWKHKYPDFLESIKKGKTIADMNVSERFYEKAKGCKVIKTKIEVDSDGDLIRKTVEETEIPPDTAAGFIWLKNRQPKKWRDKHEIEHSGEINNISREEREQRIKELMAKAKEKGKNENSN